MNIKRIILTIFFSLSSLQAYIPFGEADIAKEIVLKAKEYNIDYRMLYTIVSVESDFEPLAIAVETSYHKAMVLKNLESKNIRIRTGITYHSRISLVSLYPDSYDTAVFIIAKLEELGFIFDVGLMQVNTVNFTLDEVKEMLSPRENLDKACKHLSACIGQFKSVTHQVECYNRGAKNLRRMLKKGKHYYPYWERYKEHWKMYF